VAENWILNASPLIVLARIGREDLILNQADQVVVPQAVATEIEAGPTRDPARRILAAGDTRPRINPGASSRFNQPGPVERASPFL